MKESIKDIDLLVCYSFRYLLDARYYLMQFLELY